MESIIAKATKRDGNTSAKNVRREGFVPGIIYGSGEENISLQIDNSTALKTFRKAGRNHIVKVEIDGKNIDTLIKDIQKDPVKGDLTHIDFVFVKKGQVVTATIPLVFEGVAAAVSFGAIIEEKIKELEVECQPTDLVDSFVVNISSLAQVGDEIRISDLGIDSKKYKLVDREEDDVVVSANEFVEYVEKEVSVDDVVVEGAEDEEKAEK